MRGGRSREGAWIEMERTSMISSSNVLGRSREGAWIEIICAVLGCGGGKSVAPVRERGLKLLRLIVICIAARVAPVRERGLKLQRCQK